MPFPNLILPVVLPHLAKSRELLGSQKLFVGSRICRFSLRTRPQFSQRKSSDTPCPLDCSPVTNFCNPTLAKIYLVGYAHPQSCVCSGLHLPRMGWCPDSHLVFAHLWLGFGSMTQVCLGLAKLHPTTWRSHR